MAYEYNDTLIPQKYTIPHMFFLRNVNKFLDDTKRRANKSKVVTLLRNLKRIARRMTTNTNIYAEIN